MYPTKTMSVIFLASALSGLLNYDGLTTISPTADWWLKSVFALTAIVITMCLSLFWKYAFGVVPDLSLGLFRARGWLIVGGGVGLILALSTYWNVVSLTKNEIVRMSGASVVVRAEQRLALATRTVNGYQTYLADLSALGTDTRALQRGEEAGGSSGIASAGPVSKTFGQVAGRVDSLIASVAQAKLQIEALQSKSALCLADLSEAMNGSNAQKASKAISCLNDALSQMAGLDIAATINRGLSDLTSGVVLPVKLKTQEQRQAINRFMREIKSRSATLAAKIASRPKLSLPEPLTIDQPNILHGVLLHWRSLIPSIATALAIDLLPFVLLLFTALRYDDQKARNEPRILWSATDLLDAIQQVNALERALGYDQPKPDLPDYIDIEPTVLDETFPSKEERS